MDTDGSINKDGAIEFTNTCEKLVDDLIDILRGLGITCTKSADKRVGDDHVIKGHVCKRSYYYRVFINTSQPIFKLPRKLDRVKKKPTNAERYVSIVNAEYINEYTDMQCISVDSSDHTYITKDYIVTHNTFILALYSILRALFLPDRKIVVVGSVFRQSKYIYDYMETFWRNSPILRDLCDSGSGPRKDVDMCKMIINGSTVTALPIGTGEKIRGQRANDVLADEFASHSRQIFENVIAGFAAVTSSPADNVRKAAKKRRAIELDIDLTSTQSSILGNQIVIAGTAYYDFNHFAEYHKRWRSIINSRGDEKKLLEIFNGDIPKNFHWSDYSIIRLPYTMLPEGFMDEGQIARSKATVHTGIFDMEFNAIFAKDSQGFFKRSLIESCVGTEESPVVLSSGPVFFPPSLRGNPNKKYVIGVDPASEIDNFSIVIVEDGKDHRRLVYVWTTNRRNHMEMVNAGLTEENNFYSFCARKIRNLMQLFPTARICMDSQGGGVAVREALHDENALHPGEIPIWEIIEEDKEKESDDKAGLHILEMCNFANYDWLSAANHGLRQDFENKMLIFPEFDPITIAMSAEEDKSQVRLYDSLEDCIIEIEELKNELCLIEMTKTPTGRDKWDTPEVKIGVGKKERMRKDRYSALLMANAGAKAVMNAVPTPMYTGYGGFAESLVDKPKTADFSGPDWFVSAIKGVY
jgi:hypothetical protein